MNDAPCPPDAGPPDAGRPDADPSRGQGGAVARLEREAAALRENLRRRKEQQRLRAAGVGPVVDGGAVR